MWPFILRRLGYTENFLALHVSSFSSFNCPAASCSGCHRALTVCTVVNKKRPVNLDLGTISLPLPALASFLHRVSGVFLLAGVAVLLWLLDASLAGEESFATVKGIANSFICKLIVWAVSAGLIYHTVAGVKHLVMDLGYGESLEGGIKGAKIVFAVSIVLIVLVGAWIW